MQTWKGFTAGSVRLVTSSAGRALLILLFIADLSGSPFTAALFGQQAVTSATVTGSVEDASGGRVIDSNIIATNRDTNQSWKTTTDSQGRFRLSYLPVGNYEIRAEHEGFAPFSQQLTLSVGQALDLPLKLAVAGSNETVVVTGDSPVIETVRTQLAQTVAPREIENLPLNGRNFVDLALLSPNVSRTYATTNDRFAETSAVPGTTLTVAGQRNLGNAFVVDGLSANDDAADLAGTFYSQEVIREFQVVTSGGVAEFGRAYSGTVNVLTQTGANQWRGRLYGFLRNQRLDGANDFASVDPSTNKRRKDPLTQTQYGVTLGGPIKKDRAFLFSNFEQEHLNRAGFITITPANAAVVNQQLSAIGFTSSNVTTGEYPTGDSRTSYFVRGDYSLSDRNRLSARYNFYDIFSPNARNVGTLNSISRGTRVADRDNNLGLSDQLTVSSDSVNELRFQYTRSRLDAIGNDIVGPAVTITNVASFGSSTSSPTARNTDLIEMTDNFSTQKGAHFIKAGIDLFHNRVLIVFPASIYGSYTFSSLANFMSGNYNANNGFTQSFGKADWFQTNPNFGWFLQDEWKPLSNLTINAGLRHDVQWATLIGTNSHNFSPRIGAAYAPGNHKTVIRTGFGLYYDRVPLRAIANAMRGDGTAYKTISVGPPPQVGAPAFPNKLTAVPPGVLLALSLIDPQIKQQYSLQANLQVERELMRGTSVSLGYQHLRGMHIIMQRNLNPAACTAATDPVNLCRPNPSFANINQYSGQGDSYYNGMSVSVQNHSLNWAFLRLSYTWSKAIDNTGNAFFNSPQDNSNLRDDRGLSDNDQRHRLTLSGQLQAPQAWASGPIAKRALAGFQFSTILTHSSPYPLNPLSGVNTVPQGTAQRAVTAAGTTVGRNVGVGFPFTTVDLRVSRTFSLTERWRLETLAEAFNVLNHPNYLNPNTTFGAPNFATGAGIYPDTLTNVNYGKPQAAFDPRQIQFGLRLNF